jgi:hypothetical protein
MPKHRARWDLAPTGFLTLILASGGVGLVVGPSFTRPDVAFEVSAPLAPVGSGQVGPVEHALAVAAPAPAAGSRPTDTSPSVGRAGETVRPTPVVAFPPPATPIAPETAVPVEPTPAADETQVEPTPTTSPEADPTPMTKQEKRQARRARREAAANCGVTE